MALKLFKAGYAELQHLVVAESLSDAVNIVGNNYNINYLPLVAEQIDNIDGYNIVALTEDEMAEIKEALEIKDKIDRQEIKLPSNNTKKKN